MRTVPGCQAFTLIELLLLVIALTVASTLALPAALRSRIGLNEEGAVELLAIVRSAQDLWQERRGENGRLMELGLNLPLLPPELQPGLDGKVLRGGYLFREAYDADARPQGCWAWPKMRGYSGRRVFWLDYGGLSIHEVHAQYEGRQAPPLEAPPGPQLGPPVTPP